MASSYAHLVRPDILGYLQPLSEENQRLLDLLILAVGRPLEKVAKADRDWRTESRQHEIPHVVDWLRSALLAGADWLQRTDPQKRPLKLMKIGSLAQAIIEADKAMRLANQRAFKALSTDDDGSELFHEISDDLRLVRLLTPEALDRESSAMGHCIGNGGYDHKLERDDVLFLSLRDRRNRPHATIEIDAGVIRQVQGKQNKTPIIKYIAAAAPFLMRSEWSLGVSIRNLGCLIDTDGRCHPLDKLPEGLVYNGEIELSDGEFRLDLLPEMLPENMTIRGNLRFTGKQLTGLPRGLRIDGNLEIYSRSAWEIPNDLVATQGICILDAGPNMSPGALLRRFPVKWLRDCPIRFTPEDTIIEKFSATSCRISGMPPGMHITGDLDLYCCEIDALPEGLSIDGDLRLRGTNLTELPDHLTVGGGIDLAGTHIQRLGKHTHIRGSLLAGESALLSLPDGLRVDGSLNAHHCNIHAIPLDLQVGHACDLSCTSINTVPDDLKVGASLSLHGTSIRNLPDGLAVDGDLDIQNTNLEELPHRLSVSGHLSIDGTRIRELPADLAANSISLWKTGISTLPETFPDSMAIMTSSGDHSTAGRIRHPETDATCPDCNAFDYDDEDDIFAD